MFLGKTISLIIPCYNEEEGLPFVLKRVPAWVDEIILVDNNSTDMTAEIGKKAGARVFREPNQGYGHAYHTGFREAKGEVIVTMDGDGTYPAEEIERLCGILIHQEFDFISASRFPLSDPFVMDFVSKVGNFLLTKAIRLIMGIRFYDSQSGMWVFRKECLSRLTLKSGGMPFSEEIKIEAVRRKLKFREVPIPYQKRFGKKKIKKFRDGLRNLLFLILLRFRP